MSLALMRETCSTSWTWVIHHGGRQDVTSVRDSSPAIMVGAFNWLMVLLFLLFSESFWLLISMLKLRTIQNQLKIPCMKLQRGATSASWMSVYGTRSLLMVWTKLAQRLCTGPHQAVTLSAWKPCLLSHGVRSMSRYCAVKLLLQLTGSAEDVSPSCHACCHSEQVGRHPTAPGFLQRSFPSSRDAFGERSACPSFLEFCLLLYVYTYQHFIVELSFCVSLTLCIQLQCLFPGAVSDLKNNEGKTPAGMARDAKCAAFLRLSSESFIAS